MALAILHHEDSEGDQLRFHFDIGRNRFFAYAIGKRDSEPRKGIPILSDPSFTSSLQGPLSESDNGRGEFTIPASLFNRENNVVQLVSYRTRDRVGPAFSAPLHLPITGSPTSDTLPEINFSLKPPVVKSYTSSYRAPSPHRAIPRARQSSARLRSIRTAPTLSRAQNFDLSGIGSALLSTLPTLFPMLLPSSTGSTGANILRAGQQFLNNPSVSNTLNQILNSILQGAGISLPTTPAPAVPAVPTTPPATPPATPDATARTASLALINTARRSRSFSSSQARSEAMIAPALLAALPALMPLLQNVLSPQTIQSVLQTADPNRLIGTVTQAIGQLGQLGAQIDQQQMQHLERLNPGVDDPALMGLLQQLSTNFRESSTSFRQARGVRLHLADLTPLPLEGRSLPLLKIGSDWSFPLAVETPKPIPPAELRLIIKHAHTLEVVVRNRVKTPPLPEGRLPISNSLRSDQLTDLRPGEEYLACFDLIWKNKSGQRVGAHITQSFATVDEFTYDGIEESGESTALNDIDEHRDFWHQVWTANLSREVNRAEIECSYRMLIQGDEVANAYVATTTKTTEKGLHRRQLKIQSGILLSLNRLNELLPKISSYEVLSEKELAALLAPGFARAVQYGARTSVKFSGRPGQTAALWVFPEMKLKSVMLQSAAETNANGHVVRLEPHIVHFPIPCIAHFVGVRSR